MIPTFHFRQVYSHNNRITVMVEFVLETDYAARTDEFIEFSRDVATHIAAMNPPTVAALLKEPFVKDTSVKMGALLEKLTSTLRERILITRFVRWGDEPPDTREPPPDSPAAVRLRA